MTDELKKFMEDTTDEWWSQEEEVVEQQPFGNTRFVQMRLYLNIPVIRTFNAADTIPFPGLPGTYFDQGSNTFQPTGRDFELTAMRLGQDKNKYKVHLLVTLGYKEDGSPIYKYWKQFNNFKDWDKDTRSYRPNAWTQFQRPEIEKIPLTQRKALANTGKIAANDPDDPKAWVYAQYTEKMTGYTGQFDPPMYAGDIIIFSNAEAWKKASEEFWAERTGGNGQSNSVSYDHYPKAWADTPKALGDYVQKLVFQEGRSPRETAIETFLMDGEGNPYETVGGGTVKPIPLMIELLGIEKPNVPEPMLKWEAVDEQLQKDRPF